MLAQPAANVRPDPAGLRLADADGRVPARGPHEEAHPAPGHKGRTRQDNGAHAAVLAHASVLAEVRGEDAEGTAVQPGEFVREEAEEDGVPPERLPEVQERGPALRAAERADFHERRAGRSAFDKTLLITNRRT